MTRPFCWWPGGVPDSVRSAMLIYCPPVTAPVVEHISNALNTGCLKSQDVTIPLLQELNTRLGWGLARNTITRFFDSPMNRIFFTKLAGDSVSRTKAKVTNRLDSKSGKNSAKRGRQPAIYRLMEPDQLLGILCNYVSAAIRTRSIPRFDKDILIQAGIQSGQPAKLARFFSNLTQEAGIEPPEPVKVEPVEDWLHQTYSTPLPIDWPLNNVQQYREAFLHSIILHNAKVRRSRREIRCLLGISNSSIKRYLNGARAHNIQQFEEVPVPESVGSREELLTFIRGQIKSVKGFPLSLLINKNGFSQNGHLDYLADEQLSIWVEDPDVTLHVRFQLASEQELNDRSIARRLSELTYEPSTLIPYVVKATIEPPALQNMGQVLSHLRQILQYLTDWHIDADYVIDPQTGTILANGSNARSLVSLILAVQYPRKPA